MPSLHHLALPDDWAAAADDGEYTWSTRGRSLADEGFIHCSYPHQLEATANRFYADVPSLVVLTIDPSRLAAPVVVEAAEPGGEEFPHLYGPLPVDAVTVARVWERAPDGRYSGGA